MRRSYSKRRARCEPSTGRAPTRNGRSAAWCARSGRSHRRVGSARVDTAMVPVDVHKRPPAVRHTRRGWRAPSPGAREEDPSRRSPGGPVPMLIPATQLRVGMIVQHQNDLWRVMNVVHVTPGNWRGMVQTKLRNLRTGSQTEYRFRSEDKAERITLEQHVMEFLYESDGQYHFMNTENYEQTALDAEALGDSIHYLLPNSRIEVEFHESKPM